MSKYGNRKVQIDGYTFDSQAEGRRYQELKLMSFAGEIIHIEVHPKFEINIEGKHICNYFADFSYARITPCSNPFNPAPHVVEDVKGCKTEAYKIKKKLVEAIYGVTIVEVTA